MTYFKSNLLEITYYQGFFKVF